MADYSMTIKLYLGTDKKMLIIPYTTNESGFDSSFDKYYFIECIQQDIGNAVLRSIEDIKTLPFIQSKDTKLTWQEATGAKNWKLFSKEHTSISLLFGIESGYKLYPCKRDSKGAYVATTDDKEIKLNKNASPEEIGSAVLKVFEYAK